MHSKRKFLVSQKVGSIGQAKRGGRKSQTFQHGINVETKELQNNVFSINTATSVHRYCGAC